MYKHHEESLKILIDYFKEKEGVIALVFGGSVAKGMERPDSDLDAMVIVTDECYAEKKATNSITETVDGMCTYEGGYFDIKYMTKDYIKMAATKASEPTRNSFLCAQVLFSSDPEIESIVNAIPVFQEEEMDAKMLSFYSNLRLNYDYFWKTCKPDGFMRLHTANDIIYSCYRMILQENRILFPCNRRLEETVEKAPNKPENFVALCKEFCTTLDDTLCDRIVKSYLDWTTYPHTQDFSAILSTYSADFEQWWCNPRPLVIEW